jgi:hypothetical protein
MIRRRKVRDNALLDALEASPAVEFEGAVWRIVRGDRDPVLGSSPRGRWDDGTFDVLYTSMERDGALAEMNFHAMRGQPIFPSKMEFRLYELDLVLRRALRLVDTARLEAFGLDATKYGSLEYERKQEEYPRMQEIGEAAHFLEFDALVVPSARWSCQNVVVFTDRVPPAALSIVGDHGPVDLQAWGRETKATTPLTP